MTPRSAVEDLLRELAPQVLAALLRRHGDFGAAEDAVQEALLAAATGWPERGFPDDPRAWLLTVASRRLTDQWRSDGARRRNEEHAARREPDAPPAPSAHDDSLLVLFLCCHPALAPSAAIALTLRAVGGLTTREIGRALLLPEATVAQRISRAKRTLRGAPGGLITDVALDDRPRLRSVLHVLYLMFNEGYTASSGSAVARAELSGEAIRLARALHRALPGEPEVAGLLALMLLTDARRPARTGPSGELVPLAEQDRSRWDAGLIAEGIALISAALPQGAVGDYQLQAAIAAVHDEAPDAEATDWPQILALYGLLERMTANPMVSLNRAVALAMVEGPAAGLEVLDELSGRLPGHHRVDAVRAHLLELAGDRDGALSSYRTAAERTASEAERGYLLGRAAALGA